MYAAPAHHVKLGNAIYLQLALTTSIIAKIIVEIVLALMVKLVSLVFSTVRLVTVIAEKTVTVLPAKHAHLTAEAVVDVQLSVLAC